MHLARQHALTSHPPAPAFLHAAFFSVPASSASTSPSSSGPAVTAPTGPKSSSAAPDLFTCATPTGFLIARTSPLQLLARRDYRSAEGGLAFALPVEHSSLLLLVGGGRVPRFAPNKLVLWDEAASAAEAASRPGSGVREGHPSQGAGDTARSRTGAAGPPMASASSSSLNSADDSVLGSIGDEAQSGDDEDDDASSASSMASSRPSSSSELGGRSMYVSAMYATAASSAFQGKPDARNERKTSRYQPTDRAAAKDAEPAIPAGVKEPTPRQDPDAGAAVAELEFSEAVTGVEVHSFSLPPLAETMSPGNVTQSRLDEEQASVPRKAHIVVVVLRTKAMVFELGSATQLQSRQPPLASVKGKERERPELAQDEWAIVHRATVEIAEGGRQGLAAIAPASSLSYPTGQSQKRSRRASSAALIALPGRQKGHVQLVRVPLLSDTSPSLSSTQADAVPIGASTVIIAHSSALNSITLSPCGRLLITSSDRGTLIRLWSVNGDAIRFGQELGLTAMADVAPITSKGNTSTPAPKPTLIRELRRGTDQAYILSLAIAPDLSALAVASDKGTVHIFRLGHLPSVATPKDVAAIDPEQVVAQPTSPKASSGFHMPKALRKATSITRKHILPTATSSLSLLPGSNQLKKYLASEWATAHFRIPLRTFGGRSAEGTWGERGGPGGVESPQVRVVLKRGTQATTTAGTADDSATNDEHKTHHRPPVEAIAGGSARSTEGGWAAMRARIDDVRRGEAGLDEKVFLTWTPATRIATSTPSSTLQMSTTRYELIALTTGGGWYRIGLSGPSDVGGEGDSERSVEHHPASSPSTKSDNSRPALDKAEERRPTHQRLADDNDDEEAAAERRQRAADDRQLEKSGAFSGCVLLEYRRFGQRDEWALGVGTPVAAGSGDAGALWT